MNSTLNVTRKTAIARIAKKPILLYFCEPSQCANNGNPFRVKCQDLANRKQDVFGMKTTSISNSWRKKCLTFHSLHQRSWKSKIRSYLPKDLIETFFHPMNILDLPVTIQTELGKMWRGQSNFKRSGIKTRSSYKKAGKCFTVIKTLYSNLFSSLV